MADIDGIGTALVRRHIGRRLGSLRKQAGLTIKKAAMAVELSESTIIRMEDGIDTVRFKDVQVNHMLTVYNAPAEERAVLMALAAETRAGRTTSWWHNYTKTALPTWFGLYAIWKTRPRRSGNTNRNLSPVCCRPRPTPLRS